MTVNKRLNAEELEAIRKRAEAATPGPWLNTRWHVATEPDTTGGYPPSQESICETFDGEYIENPNGLKDAEFIAHDRQDVPNLLAEIERLSKTLDYINDLAGEFFTVEDEEGVFSIPNEQPHKDTMQEIFVISYEAVNADD
jgi:hypothetical protein